MPVLFIASVYTHYPGAWLSQEISGAILVVHMCTKDAGWSAVGVVLLEVRPRERFWAFIRLYCEGHWMGGFLAQILIARIS